MSAKKSKKDKNRHVKPLARSSGKLMKDKPVDPCKISCTDGCKPYCKDNCATACKSSCTITCMDICKHRVQTPE